MVILCAVPSFALDSSAIDEAETAILEAVASGADIIANGAIDIALKYAPEILPESVKVMDKSEYGYVRVYVGDDGKSFDGCGCWGVTSPGPNGSVDVYKKAYHLINSMK